MSEETMSESTHRADGTLVRELLSVADLLADPALAQLHAYLARGGEATVREMMDALDLPQGTAYSYVNRLVDAGLIEETRTAQPRAYIAREIDLSVTADDDEREYSITPMLIDAVGRRTEDDDIDTHTDRHGIDGLATALTYTIARERGEITHEVMARDLGISPLAAEYILQALRPVVHDHVDLDVVGGSIEDIAGVDRDVTDDV